MSIPHFFISDVIVGSKGDRVIMPIPVTTAHHLHTLRLRKNEHIVLVDSPGHGWELELTSDIGRQTRGIEGTLVSEHRSTRQTDLTLVQGISSADRMDQTIRQVTELGAARIMPLESERSTVHLDAEQKSAKLQRWQRIAQGAAEQSGQLFEPQIDRPSNLAKAMQLLTEYDLLLFFWEEAGGCSLAKSFDARSLIDRPPKVALLIGPEGGFSHEEARFIQASGAETVTLGTTILRTETAAVVATALVLYHLGALSAH